MIVLFSNAEIIDKYLEFKGNAARAGRELAIDRRTVQLRVMRDKSLYKELALAYELRFYLELESITAELELKSVNPNLRPFVPKDDCRYLAERYKKELSLAGVHIHHRQSQNIDEVIRKLRKVKCFDLFQLWTLEEKIENGVIDH